MKSQFALLLVAVTAAVACGEAPDPSPVNARASGPRSGGVGTGGGNDGSGSTSGNGGGLGGNPGPTGGTVDSPADDGGTGPSPLPPRPADAGPPPSDTPDAGTTTPPPSNPAAAVASGVTISEIAVYQGVKISIVKGGARVATRNAPVVAKRSALVRVSVARAAGYGGQSITAELRLGLAGGTPTVFRDSKVVPATVADGTLASTFNFDVPGDAVAADTQFSVTLTDPAAAAGSQGAAGARYPASGALEDLDALSSGDQLKVVLVPFRYDADGSGRLPDLGAAQVERYRATIYSLYPAAKVDISIHAAYPFAQEITADGGGFSEALQALVRLRAQERPTSDVYYYGMFVPMTSFSTYCRSGCVLGLSGLGTRQTDAAVRASVGAGFTGQESAETAAHEIGHAHGRSHAPCGGPAGPDPNFPYSGGTIGVWGYNLVSKVLVSPSTAKDFMGYCSPTWISDYNYKALYDRVKFVNGASVQTFAEPQAYRMIDVAADGALTWRDTLKLDSPPSAEPRDVTYVDGAGRTVATTTGQFYAYDHLPGGYMLVPESPRAYAKARVAGMGETR